MNMVPRNEASTLPVAVSIVPKRQLAGGRAVLSTTNVASHGDIGPTFTVVWPDLLGKILKTFAVIVTVAPPSQDAAKVGETAPKAPRNTHPSNGV